MEKREVKIGVTYQHFKGNKYKILAIALHSETGESLVIYQSLDDPQKVWARPYSLFISEVDHTKYPDVSQKWRFTLIND